jgi:hypothetical protein
MKAPLFKGYFAISYDSDRLMGSPIADTIVATIALCGKRSWLMYCAMKYLTKMKHMKIRSPLEGASGSIGLGLV